MCGDARSRGELRLARHLLLKWHPGSVLQHGRPYPCQRQPCKDMQRSSPLVSPCHSIAQVSSPLELATELLCPLAEAAAVRPRLAAALASGSLLGRMLQLAGQLASSSEDAAIALVSVVASFGTFACPWECVDCYCAAAFSAHRSAAFARVSSPHACG